MPAFKFLTCNWFRIVVVSFSTGFAWAGCPFLTEKSSLGDCASSGGPWIKNGSPWVDCCWTSLQKLGLVSWICQAQLCDLSYWRHECCLALIGDHPQIVLWSQAYVRHISLHNLYASMVESRLGDVLKAHTSCGLKC